jgi:hypothetical protein
MRSANEKTDLNQAQRPMPPRARGHRRVVTAHSAYVLRTCSLPQSGLALCPNLIDILHRFSGPELAIRLPQALQRGRQIIVALHKSLNPVLNVPLNGLLWNSGWWHVARTHKCRSQQRVLRHQDGAFDEIFQNMTGDVFVTQTVDNDGPISSLFIPRDLKI